ncbi:MAG: hypothetical protein ACLU99_11355 [Alphaproteobacteria bacterium]
MPRQSDYRQYLCRNRRSRNANAARPSANSAENNPDARIVVTGCAAQVAPSKVRRHAGSRPDSRQQRKSRNRKIHLHPELAEKTIVGDIISYDDSLTTSI